MSEPVKRRKLSLSDKVAILLRQAICPLCLQPLGSGPIRWDHPNALWVSGDDSNENRWATHLACDKVKTYGAPTKTSSRDSDIGTIAHVKRAGKKEAAFRSRVLAKGTGAAAVEKPKRKIQSRGFRTRPSTPSERPR